jgi:two-component system, chemotaxis family, chemotaxis protein CheY
MPDVVVLAYEQDECFQLVSFLEKSGMRVKFSLDRAHVSEWLQLKSFDMACVDFRLGIEEQEQIAGQLWEKNPQASLVVYNLEEIAKLEEKKARLIGAEFAYGKKAFEHISRVIARQKNQKLFSQDDFKILVVDDLDSPRDIICSVIESIGFPAVTGVSSVQEAMSYLTDSSKGASCVFTDIRMPVDDGLSLIKKIRADEKLKLIPVVVLTAYGSIDCLMECLSYGASGFLVKPPRKSDLLRELSRAIKIITRGEKPGLVNHEDIDEIKKLLAERGIC